MALGGFANGQLGAALNLKAGDLRLPGGEEALRLDKWLFSESSGFVLEATPGREAALREVFAGYKLELWKLGEVTPAPALEVILDGERQLRVDLPSLREAWLGGLQKVLR